LAKRAKSTMRATLIVKYLAPAAVLTAAAALAQSKSPARRANTTVLVQQFRTRANGYITWREKNVGRAPAPTNSPEKLDDARHELANKIRTARAGAKQGQIFTPEIADYFRKQISATLNGPHGNEVRQSLRHAEPVKMDLQINQSYPANVPLQSTPPTLLLNLPELPKGMEYRIIDRELVLRDSDANIIVDYIPDAFPADTE